VTAQPSIRVAIVDDHPLFRLGLEAAVQEMDGIQVVGSACRAGDVADLVSSTDPDVVLLDIGLPDASGLEVNRWVAEHHPTVRVIMLTMSEDLDGLIGALRDGASGYLVKGADAEQIEHAIRAVASGEAVVDRSLVQPMTELIHARRATPTRPFPQLSEREFDILVLVAQGLDNAAIARQLVLSPKTVRNHVSNVFAKIHAPDRPGAIVLARRHGLGE
jgi:DNA-binding NarL/FixJ family response regulator